MGERFDPSTADYDVGYGKPPAEHQWQPGQSGNPYGRPPRPRVDMNEIAPAFAEDFLRTINLPIRNRTADGMVERSFGEAVGHTLRQIIFKGAPREQMKALELLLKHFNFVQTDGFREFVFRDLDERLAQAEARGRIGATLEYLDGVGEPSTDEDYRNTIARMNAVLDKRAAMRKAGMSDEEIYAAEKAEDAKETDLTETEDAASHQPSRPDRPSRPGDDSDLGPADAAAQINMITAPTPPASGTPKPPSRE